MVGFPRSGHIQHMCDQIRENMHNSHIQWDLQKPLRMVVYVHIRDLWVTEVGKLDVWTICMHVFAVSFMFVMVSDINLGLRPIA